jgi:hypothetical protein
MSGLSNRGGVPGVPGEEISLNFEGRAPNVEFGDINERKMFRMSGLTADLR